MKSKKLIYVLIPLILSFEVLGWGQTGHRVTAAIAEKHLSSKAQKMVKKILVNEDLAEASTFPDEMRSAPTEFWKKTAYPWHYVNVHEGQKYTDKNAPPEGDAITALKMFTQQLKDKSMSMEKKQIALKFIIHIVGDLHQPFHTGTDLDQGGNDIDVIFFDEVSNLHSVWDSGLINRQLLSYSEWAQRLGNKVTKKDKSKWSKTDPKIWVQESYELRLGLYPKKPKIKWNYQFKSLPVLKQQLTVGGIRLAAYLNHIFK